MVMERVSGIPISNVDALLDAGIDLRMLAERGVEIFFTQLMRHNFFHADMHPGNIFVGARPPRSPELRRGWTSASWAVCRSRISAISPRISLRFFNRDYRRVAELHVESKWVPSDTRIDDFEAAIRSVCEPIFDRPLKEISFGRVLVQLFQTARRFPHGGAAAARAAAEDAAQYRGARSPALPRPRPVGDRQAVPGSLDARAARPPAHCCARSDDRLRSGERPSPRCRVWRTRR